MPDGSDALSPRWHRFRDPDKRLDQRNAPQRDRDRILYSSAFRRLAGVTQVVWAREEGYLLHNRLTHSLKVAQVGRRIAEMFLEQAESDQRVKALIDKWGGLHPEVVEAAGLAHDLGHPPFGHIAEQELDAAVRRCHLDDGTPVTDGFEGNAQTFRIVTRLAQVGSDANGNQIDDGLNLTRATLNAILKYPRPWSAGQRKWGFYASDEPIFRWARDHTPVPAGRKTLEAQIMDWADDITYAVHDAEDFFRAGLIPLQELPAWTPEQRKIVLDRTAESWRRESASDLTADELAAAEGATIDFPWASRRFTGTPEDHADLRSALSAAIGRYVGFSRLSEDGLDIERPVLAEIAVLKELTRYLVIEGPQLGTQQHGQRRVIRELFAIYRTSAEDGRLEVFPTSVRDQARNLIEAKCPEPQTARFVADLIAGMTEVQATHMFQRLTGVDFGLFADPVIS